MSCGKVWSRETNQERLCGGSAHVDDAVRGVDIVRSYIMAQESFGIVSTCNQAIASFQRLQRRMCPKKVERLGKGRSAVEILLYQVENGSTCVGWRV